MTARAAARPPADPAAFTAELLAWLGLPPDARERDIEAARTRLSEFLATAPPELDAWARREAIAAQAAFAALTGRPAPVLDASTGPAAHRSDDAAAELGVVDPETGDPLPAGQAPRIAAPRPTARPVATARAARRPRLALLAALVAVPAIVLGVYFLGDRPSSSAHPGGTPSASAPAAASRSVAPADPAKVAALQAKAAKNPKDATALRALTDLYFESAEYGKAVPWQAKVVALLPKDVDQRLVLGAARFNSGDPAGAQREWQEVVRLDDRNVEAYYNLGFSHLSGNPPDVAKAKSEWAKVVQLAPDSDLAKTVKAHLNRFESMPTGAATAGQK